MDAETEGNAHSNEIVYIVREDCLEDRIKIGKSYDPYKRAKQLQTGNSRKLIVLFWIITPDAAALERRLHEHFSRYRLIGEWFNLNPSQVLEYVEMFTSFKYKFPWKQITKLVYRDKDDLHTFHWGNTIYIDKPPTSLTNFTESTSDEDSSIGEKNHTVQIDVSKKTDKRIEKLDLRKFFHRTRVDSSNIPVGVND